MKIRSEYAILSDCIERGIESGYWKAFKHTDTPTELQIIDSIHKYVMNDICEMFRFDQEEEE